MFLDAPYTCTAEDEDRMRKPENAKSGGQILEFFPKAEYGGYREWYNSTDGGEYRRLEESLAFRRDFSECVLPSR